MVLLGTTPSADDGFFQSPVHLEQRGVSNDEAGLNTSGVLRQPEVIAVTGFDGWSGSERCSKRQRPVRSDPANPES
jgi:hypothetical protein